MKQIKFEGLLEKNKSGVVCCLFLLLVWACNEDDLSNKSFTIGDDLVETSTEIIYIDTLSVNLSTVILDSVSTSNTYRMLIGNNTDGNFGAIQAGTFLELAPPSVSIGEEAVFDSLTLVLGYDGYYYGDTIEEQLLSVHALTEAIEVNADGYLYNTSNFAYNSTPLGQRSSAPTPGGGSLEIRLADSLGALFFQKLLNEDQELATESSFLEYFPGLHIRTLNHNGAVIGFSISDSASYLALHYHVINFEREEHAAVFDIVNPSDQFNKISVDRTGTNLEAWEEQRYEVSSGITQEEVYLQGGTGILTRVEFPSIDLFVELGEQASLLRAELVFEPIKGTYNQYPLPENMVLYQTDGVNRLYTPVYTSDGESIQNGYTIIDYQYHENTSISFDLTNYLRADFLDNYYDEDYGFMLGLSSTDNCKVLDRAILGTRFCNSNQPKLKVYYMLYD